jgi:hypothetical protein
MSYKKYFKLIRGYGPEDYIGIDDTELEKAQYCFLEKVDSIFSGGAIRGAEIKAIQEDYHRTMGWNRGYKLGAADFEELADKGIDRGMRDLLLETKERVMYLIKTNQTGLIGTDFKIPALETPANKEIKKLSDGIANKFNINNGKSKNS